MKNYECSIDEVKDKTLVLLDRRSAYFVYDKIFNMGINVNEPYKELNVFPYILRILRKISFVFKLPFRSIWYGEWKKTIEKYDTIILFDFFNLDILNYLSKIHKNKRIIFWYWNPVKKSVDANLVSDELCEKWSFDMSDCIKYNMKYNTTFFFNDYKIEKEKYKYDVFFVGKDKGRLEYILELKEKFENQNITTYFHIVNDKYRIRKFNKLYNKPISYKEVINKISGCKAILDILQENQEGLTLRVMESIFFEKKLITNNKDIINYDFYNKNNIFIIGIDNINNLNSFINSPYNKIDDNIVNKYDFNNWLSRFFVQKQ
ncbi:hypothetical protein [Clostridium sp. 1001271B_151109_B4]|uniref:hypothetical protein n=1 Tax=Clostridium sp. 1001271B_151109_B4 TaxID=2787148 RepID=UPI0018AA3DA1|nr:hypothetical protein [Clostridium sp. 1001271B_151109_B4]